MESIASSAKKMQTSAMKVYFQIAECSFSSAKIRFFLKDARIFGKMFEGEEDKKKKVYPRLPDVLGKKDTP